MLTLVIIPAVIVRHGRRQSGLAIARFSEA
jgi:hypothetical protein